MHRGLVWWSLVAATIVLPLFVVEGLAQSSVAPTCRGRDLLPEIIAADAEAGRRIDKAAAAVVNGEAMLWRVSRPGGPTNHLFGTVHLTDDRVNALPPAVAKALEASRQLVLEVADLSPQALGQAMAKVQDKLVFRDGRSLRTLLSPRELAVAEDASTRAGLPAEMFSVARPWLVTMLLALSDCERRRSGAGRLPLDLNLARIARERAMPVLGLERLEDQLGAMAAVPEADQLTVLRAGLELAPLTDDMLETMLQRYLAREIAKVWALQTEMWRRIGFDPAAFATFRRELITVRNAHMRDAALPILAEGNAFIAVGALHLVGGDGLVALLRDAGFEVVAAE